ncbi:molecular chaperone HtpG [Campylobacter sp. CNRCH_2016_3089]|uniref:molecular chaperone HtpG n=1 Tax=unclassified Campylobacter TaxID=2593542 RepID=UPI00179D5BB2|nr:MULTISPECIES: molecular chaperone HtpG [unclassified Campylobacter]EAI3905617.1 molecular chaperone HtpG [Campylobacter lari]EID4796000.1 molecular chaperone HtpG [Campylobacter lari]MCV3403032.1 molecular chaperone HtpG [Campylobacter sp. IFREMER_LSEM_CL2090]MCV3425019.1 molecular chaperone HtpG [Campylobacter sp. IFREMER_LSEM_CL1085]MCV3427841.1 molecular chaperone HtpG [Campylobacter sp. IFREMER_LSEM_CL1904]
MQFQTEVNQLLQLMIHSLYSNKEIFLRELISNASDALDKLSYLSVSDDAYKNLKFEPKIQINFNQEAKTLTISDNGIGMNKDDLINHLGTIAKSGTKSFLENLSGDAKKDSQLIGQFGVGFYSAFMVASKIEVLSKKALDDKAYLWTSDASGYEIEDANKDEQGTCITLHLKDEEFLNSYRIESIVEKYSNHIQFPIFMEKEEYLPLEEGEKEPKKELKNTQINTASALWRQNKASLKAEDYERFYEQNFHDSNKPMLYIHTKAEGSIEYNSLFFIPAQAPFDLYRVDYKSGLKLYVKRVFISDDDKELLPTYLRFVRGIIDVEDLPLNVSREILQENKILKSVQEASVKKILAELKKFKEKDKENYLKFHENFGKVLKEGLYGFGENKDAIAKLLYFKNSNKEELIDLEEYKQNLAEGQNEIFYISGKNEKLLRNSPLLESYKQKNINVLLLDEEIDTIVMPMMNEFEGLKFSAINHLASEETSEEQKAEFASLLIKIKEVLKDDVEEVKLSQRLSNSPSCIVYDQNKPDFAMQQILKQMGQEQQVKPILEINPNHEILKALKENDTLANEMAHILLNMAKLSEGMGIDNPSEFNNALSKIVSKALEK